MRSYELGVREKDRAMRRWYMPLTVLGLAGLAALIVRPRGGQVLAWLADNFDPEESVLPWDDTLCQLQRLQSAVDRLARSLGTAG